MVSRALFQPVQHHARQLFATILLNKMPATAQGGMRLALAAGYQLLNNRSRQPGRAGILVGLAVLSRPEFGLAAALVVGVACLRRGDRRSAWEL